MVYNQFKSGCGRLETRTAVAESEAIIGLEEAGKRGE